MNKNFNPNFFKRNKRKKLTMDISVVIDFRNTLNHFFSRNLFREYTMLNIISTFFDIRISHFVKKKKNSKKNIFFIILTKNFTTQKILKMENKHPEHFWSA